MKKLTDFLNMLAESELRAGDNSDSADFDIPIKDITYNSLEAGEGTLFICKGAGFKEEYLKDALAKGAAAFVCEMGSRGLQSGCRTCSSSIHCCKQHAKSHFKDFRLLF